MKEENPYQAQDKIELSYSQKNMSLYIKFLSIKEKHDITFTQTLQLFQGTSKQITYHWYQRRWNLIIDWQWSSPIVRSTLYSSIKFFEKEKPSHISLFFPKHESGKPLSSYLQLAVDNTARITSPQIKKKKLGRCKISAQRVASIEQNRRV